MKIEGLDELTETLDNADNNFEKESRKTLNRIGMKLKAKVVSKTPVAEKNGGTLKKSWHYKTINSNEGRLTNNVEYAQHVEYGHRTRLGTSKNPNYKPKDNAKPYIDGIYMLTKSVAEIEKELEEEFFTMIENLWED